MMTNLLDGLITRNDIADFAVNEGLILDDEERISVLEAMRSIDVQACPGSGKTTLIAAKLILLAKKWPLQHQGICVLSHTNVAKDEIIDRLKRSKTVEAQRLLSYPHFIGTIQEYVGKFVAFPLIRSDGTKINLVDTDICVDLIYSKLQARTRAYIDLKSRFFNVLYDFDLNFIDGNIAINVPTFPNGSNSRSFLNLHTVRSNLIADGYFFYRDVFTFARKALGQNEILPLALRKRFPCIFLDEMQDTQEFQDELLCRIFPLDEPSIIVQRFGDPDQAIFHGIGSEKANKTFNEKSADNMDVVIHKSHRFDDGLAGKVKLFSFNEIPLETELSEVSLTVRSESHAQGGDFEHTIIVFDDDTRASVIPFFADIVSNQFSDHKKSSDQFSVKIVGAVGNEIDPEADQLKIGHYWSGYDKEKSKTIFKEGAFIEAVHYCHQSSSIDWAGSYKLMVDCVLKFLRMTDIRDEQGRYFSTSSLRVWLKNKNLWDNFRKSIYRLLDPNRQISQRFWERICSFWKNIFGCRDIPAEAAEYLSFSDDVFANIEIVEEEEQDDASIKSLPENKIRHSDGFLLELSTIHGVKGETHDATLLVETKHHCFDLGNMMEYLTGDLPSNDHKNSGLRPNPSAQARFKPNQKFMRQFYVAMSRPRHLLCLAVHSSRLSDNQKQNLIRKGWKIKAPLPS